MASRGNSWIFSWVVAIDVTKKAGIVIAIPAPSFNLVQACSIDISASFALPPDLPARVTIFQHRGQQNLSTTSTFPGGFPRTGKCMRLSSSRARDPEYPNGTVEEKMLGLPM
jgi:hypothetical protein